MGALVVALYLTVFKLCVLIGPDLIQAGVFVYFGLSLLGLSREVPAHWVAGMIAYFLGRIALERYQPQWAHRVHTALSAVWTLALGIAVAADPRFHPVYAVLGAIVGALVGSYVNFGSPIAFPLVLEHQFIQLSRRFSAWRAQRTAHSPLRGAAQSSRNTSAPRTRPASSQAPQAANLHATASTSCTSSSRSYARRMGDLGRATGCQHE